MKRVVFLHDYDALPSYERDVDEYVQFSCNNWRDFVRYVKHKWYTWFPHARTREY